MSNQNSSPIKPLDDYEDSPLVYGDHERFDDERLAYFMEEFNDCLPGLQHVAASACGDVFCLHCGRKFTA